MTADARLKSFIDRVLRLKEEQDALADDIREVYAEAKGEGYDKTAMGALVSHLRKVEKKGADAVGEAETIFNLYLDAYQRAVSEPRTGTPMRAREEDISYTQLKTQDAKALASEKEREPVDWDEISRREFPDDSPVKVYFIEAPSLGLIKIGSTGMVDRRIAAIQRGIPVPTSLVGVIAGGAKRESELHKKYEAHRVHGEWFSEVIRPELELLLTDQAIIEEFPTHDAETGEIKDEPEAAAEVAGDYLREPVAAEQGQIIREGDAPRETGRLGGDASRPDAEYSHSQASPPPADSAGEAPSSSPASPACHSDDIDLTIPDFLRRTEGGYPKREAVEA